MRRSSTSPTASAVTGFDLLVLVLLPFFAWAGYRQGFLVSVLSFGGFLVGVVLGLAAAPVLLGSLSPGLTRAALALALVLLLGAVVQSLAAFLGRTLRAVVSHGPPAGSTTSSVPSELPVPADALRLAPR